MKFKRYRDWPILWKIMVIPLMSLFLILIGTELIIIPRIESWLMEQEKHKVRSLVEVAYQRMLQGGHAADQGKMSVEAAQKEAMEDIKKIRYSGSEYFWINDLAPKMVMHPTKPELDGKDLSDYKDPRGKFLFMEFVKVCKENGEGFVAYMWPKPGESAPVPKISYVKLYKPWGWIIGSGLYVDSFKKSIQGLHIFILAASAALSFIMAVLAWSVGRGVKRSIDQGCSFAATVASGDLTSTLAVTRGDEAGDLANSLNAMVSGLRSMIGRITDDTRELMATSGEIGAASRNMVRSAEQQATDVRDTSVAAKQIHHLIDTVTHDVEGLNSSASQSSSAVLELAASIEEVAMNMASLAQSVDGISESISQMIETIRQIDGNVQALRETSTAAAASVLEFDTSIKEIERYAIGTAAISEKVRSDAETGKKSVDETIVGINVIKDASQVTADVINALSEKMKSIGSIVTIIEDVADQTNLLALNASIIAAQAGEQGKGFGVVASEIKHLAERTGRSTREIGESIKDVQAETRRAVNAIVAAEESIRTGEILSLRAGEALGKIVEGVEQSALQMAEIARTTREQTRGSEHIRSAMEQFAAMTGAISETTHEQQKGSELIDSQAATVREFAFLVTRSMKEQAKVSDQISRMTEGVSESTGSIQEACLSQYDSSLRIQNAVESIQNSAATVLSETKVVDNGLSKLGKNIDSLQKEMEKFKL